MGVHVADCPAVSLRFEYLRSRGGKPLYDAELLKQCSSVKNKAIGLIFFAELEFSCIRSTLEQKNDEKSDEIPSRSAQEVPFFTLWPNLR